MAKKISRGSIIGAVGSVLVGAAILLFVCTIVLNSLKDAAKSQPDSDTLNTTIDQIKSFLTVSAILLSVLGIVMIGAAIISYIGGAFGA